MSFDFLYSDDAAAFNGGASPNASGSPEIRVDDIIQRVVGRAGPSQLAQPRARQRPQLQQAPKSATLARLGVPMLHHEPTAASLLGAARGNDPSSKLELQFTMHRLVSAADQALRSAKEQMWGVAGADPNGAASGRTAETSNKYRCDTNAGVPMAASGQYVEAAQQPAGGRQYSHGQHTGHGQHDAHASSQDRSASSRHSKGQPRLPPGAAAALPAPQPPQAPSGGSVFGWNSLSSTYDTTLEGASARLQRVYEATMQWEAEAMARANLWVLRRAVSRWAAEARSGRASREGERALHASAVQHYERWLLSRCLVAWQHNTWRCKEEYEEALIAAAEQYKREKLADQFHRLYCLHAAFRSWRGVAEQSLAERQEAEEQQEMLLAAVAMHKRKEQVSLSAGSAYVASLMSSIQYGNIK